MGIHQSITPSQMQMNEAHRARQARFAAAARKMSAKAVTAPVIDVRPAAKVISFQWPKPRAKAIPKRIPQNMWEKARLTFNQHVIDYRVYLLRQAEMDSGDASAEPDIKQGYKPIIDIVFEVLEDFPGLTVDDLKGRSRTTNIVKARQVAMYEIYRQRDGIGYPRIGRWFGGRDHTTVLHSVRKIEAERAAE